MKPIDEQKHVAEIRARFVHGPWRKAGLSAGDYVRISKTKGRFDKGYFPNWFEEVFRIKAVHRMKPVMYEIEDLDAKEVNGLVYKEEKQRVNKPDSCRVEKIIKTRKRSGKAEYFVKW